MAEEESKVAVIPTTPDPVAGRRTIVPIRIKQGDLSTMWKTFLSYGRSGSGKTRFLASWPRVLVIADASERGWTTIETMPEAEFYEPNVAPLVWPVSDASQMAEALRDARPLVDRGEVFTVGIDSATFYLDSYLTYLKRRTIEANPGKAIDTRALYGALAEHTKVLQQDLHRWPCNIGWLALEQSPSQDAPLGGPLLIGKAKEQLPARCDHIFYHRSYTAIGEDDEPGRYFETHTTAFEKYLVRGRDSGRLPASIFNATYRDIEAALELPNPIEAFAKAQAQAKAAPAATRRVVK